MMTYRLRKLVTVFFLANFLLIFFSLFSPSIFDITVQAQTNSGGGGGLQCPDDLEPDSSGVTCLPKNNYSDDSLIGSKTASQLIARVVNILLYFGGIIAVVFIIIGGYQYITSTGSEEAAGKGRKTLTYAIIGLLVIIFSYAIVNILVNQLSST